MTEFLEQCVERAYTLMTQICAVYYDEAHFRRYLNDEETKFIMAELANGRKFSVSVKEGSMLPKDSTSKRQEASLQVARQVDLMLVIGGKHSANTTRLAELCAETGTPTRHVETAAELQPEWLPGVGRVGVTAGASTPDWAIEELVARLQDLAGYFGLVLDRPAQLAQLAAQVVAGALDGGDHLGRAKLDGSGNLVGLVLHFALEQLGRLLLAVLQPGDAGLERGTDVLAQRLQLLAVGAESGVVPCAYRREQESVVETVTKAQWQSFPLQE